MGGRFLRHAFEHPVEICDAIESAIIRHRGDAVIIAIRQLLARLVDPNLVEEGDEGMHGVFFKVPAEGLRSHVRLFGRIFQGNGFIILLHDKIVDGADADAFMFTVGGGL